MKAVTSMMQKRKGLAELPQTALYVIVLVVVVAVGATLVTQIRSTQTAGAYDYNVTTKGLDALVQYSNWFVIIVIIVIMAVIIGLLLRSFLRGGGGA